MQEMYLLIEIKKKWYLIHRRPIIEASYIRNYQIMKKALATQQQFDTTTTAYVKFCLHNKNRNNAL